MRMKNHFIALLILALASFAAHADMTMLMFATEDKNAAEAWLLLAAGADVNARNKDGQTALMLAAMKNSTDFARLLLATNADIATKDDDDRTALMFATDARAVYVAELLKAAGREPVNVPATEHAEFVEFVKESAIPKPAPATGKTAVVTENLRLRTDDSESRRDARHGHARKNPRYWQGRDNRRHRVKLGAGGGARRRDGQGRQPGGGGH